MSSYDPDATDSESDDVYIVSTDGRRLHATTPNNDALHKTSYRWSKEEVALVLSVFDYINPSNIYSIGAKEAMMREIKKRCPSYQRNSTATVLKLQHIAMKLTNGTISRNLLRAVNTYTTRQQLCMCFNKRLKSPA